MSQITEVITDVNRPVLVEFQNPMDPSGVSVPRSAVFKNQTSRKRVLGLASQNMVYAGEIEDGDELYNNFLVIRDPKTNEIKLIQLDNCLVTPLIPKNTVNTKSPVTDKSAAHLKKEFGSKKAKRVTEQQERLKTNLENVKEHLEATVADVEVSMLDVSLPDGTQSDYKPKINRDASAKEFVYILADLVPQDVLNSLDQKASEVLGSQNLEDFGLVPFVSSAINSLQLSAYTDETKLEKCKILLYVNYLAKYSVTPLKNMSKKFVVCDCSHTVDIHIKQNFSINGHRPLSMKDKCLCHVLVLYLLAKDYEADLEILARDLKVGMKKLVELSRVLAFSQSSGKKTTVVLKVPLPPPVTPFLKKRRT